MKNFIVSIEKLHWILLKRVREDFGMNLLMLRIQNYLMLKQYSINYSKKQNNLNNKNNLNMTLNSPLRLVFQKN